MAETSEGESSLIVSETDHDSELDPPSSCSGLLDSDRFSETPSEFLDTEGTSASQPEEEDVETEQDQGGEKTKRKRTTHLAYQRKFEKKSSRSQGAVKTETETEDIGDIINILDDNDQNENLEFKDMLLGNEPVDTDEAKASITPSPIARAIMDNLKLLLEDSWTVDLITKSLVRLIHHNDSKNAAVDRCLFWDCEKGGVGIFVHGIPVPEDNKIFFSRAIPIIENIGSVCDYLCFLANKVLKASICTGIGRHKDLWVNQGGRVDHHLIEPCYRSLQCSMIVDERKITCQSCRNDLQKFEREVKRQERKEKVKEFNTQFFSKDSNLTKEEMKEKKEKWKLKCKVAEKKASRLQKRLESVLVKLDEVLRDDLIGILKANEHKMTPIQRLFWESQKAALYVNDRRGLRWHPMMIRIALRIRSLSAGCFEYLRDSTIMVLPSDRTLYDYSHYVDPKEGCEKEVIATLKENLKKQGPEEYRSYVNVMFDEMNIRCGLVTKRSTGELIGYTDLSTVDEELEKLTKELEFKQYKPKLAKKVLVFLAQSLTSDVKDVVAIYSTDDLTAVQLYDRAWEVVYNLEEADIKVLCLTCDGAAVNRKFIRMHSCPDESAKETYCTKNLASGDGRIIFFIIDPPHLLKTIRNALANSFCHRNTRKLWRNGEFLSWKVLETIYEQTKHEKHLSHKLTKGHVTLSSFSCMTVVFATQALSDSVANTIERMAHLPSMESFDTEELVKFIRLMNKFFDCVNGKQEDEEEVRNPDLAAYTDPNDDRLVFLSTTFLDYFEDWKKQVQDRPGIFTVSERAQMIISYQALESLQISVKSIVGVIKFMLQDVKAPAINARYLNQDPLEQYFGKIRRRQGDNRNPSLHAFLNESQNIRAQGLAAMPSKKGNTEVQKTRGLEIDDTPLLKRPRKS